MRKNDSFLATPWTNISEFDDVCGNNETEWFGTIRSPDWNKDGLYDPMVDCFWTIVADDTDEIIELNIFAMDIELDEYCDYDYVKVRVKSLKTDTCTTYLSSSES